MGAHIGVPSDYFHFLWKPVVRSWTGLRHRRKERADPYLRLGFRVRLGTLAALLQPR